MEELDDLVKQAQAGDLDAFNTLVRRFQDMAVGYAYSQLSDFHLAEDVAQEAFVGAYLNLPKLREPAAFPGWFRSSEGDPGGDGILGAGPEGRCGRHTHGDC